MYIESKFVSEKTEPTHTIKMTQKVMKWSTWPRRECNTFLPYLASFTLNDTQIPENFTNSSSTP